MKRVVFLAAGAVFLTATLAMAGPGNGNSGKGSNGQSNGAGKGKNANSEPAAEFGGVPDFTAGAAGIALFKIFDVEPEGEESTAPELSLPEAKPFSLY
jgi:hypothetical protein